MRYSILIFGFLLGCFNPDLSEKPCNESSGCSDGYFCDSSRAIASVSSGRCSPYNSAALQAGSNPLMLFDAEVKPLLGQYCSVCHKVAQGDVGAFLTPGQEYQTLTGYKMGRFVTVAMATQSLLLQKGLHTGPAFTTDQYTIVQNWLTAELAARSVKLPDPLTSHRLPTAPLTSGAVSLSFGSTEPINDGAANLKFQLALDTSGTLYRVSNLTLTAGAGGGIHIIHPKFYFLTSTSSLPDPADSLAAVDEIATAGGSITVGPGTVLLSGAPNNDASARIGVAFQLVEKK